MTETVLPTRALVGLLTDLALTASTDPELPELRSVLLHTDRGEYLLDVPDDDDTEAPLISPLESGLLVGTSTDRIVVGQAHTPAKGELPRPVRVALEDVAALVKVFKPLIGKLGKQTTHRTRIELAGDVLTVREDPRQVPDGVAVVVPALDAEAFPPMWQFMSPDPTQLTPDADGVVVEPSYGTAYGPRFVEIFGRIGRRRVMPVRWYRHHQSRVVVVEIGASYRAAVRPLTLKDPGELAAPMVRVFTPGLSAHAVVNMAELDDTEDM